MLHHSSLFLYPSLFIYPHPQAAILLLLIPLTTTNCLSTSIPSSYSSPISRRLTKIFRADVLIATCGNILEMLSRIRQFSRGQFTLSNCDYVRTKSNRFCNGKIKILSPSYHIVMIYIAYSGNIQFPTSFNVILWII